MRKAKNGHVIAYLLTDFPIVEVSYEEHETDEEQRIVATVSKEETIPWIIYTYGSHGRLGSGIVCLIINPNGG